MSHESAELLAMVKEVEHRFGFKLDPQTLNLLDREAEKLADMLRDEQESFDWLSVGTRLLGSGALKAAVIRIRNESDNPAVKQGG